MPHTFHSQGKEQDAPSFRELWKPVENVFIGMPPLEARGNRPLQMDFEPKTQDRILNRGMLGTISTNIKKNRFTR